MDTPTASPLRPTTRVRTTIRWETTRAALFGPLAGIRTDLALLVAAAWFHSPAWHKAVIAGSGSVGFLLAPAVVALAAALGAGATGVRALLLLVAAAALLFVAAVPTAWALTAGVAVAAVALTCGAPLLTLTWQGNLPGARRGRWFARVVVVEAVAALIGSLAASWWMGDDASRYRVVFAVAALCCLGAAWATARVPGPPVRARRNPLAPLAWLWRDRAFARLSMSWGIMGLANFVALPLRMDYLVHPQTGLGVAPGLALLLVVTIPLVTRIALLPWMGRVFDRVPFLTLRALLNLCFAAGIALFFLPYLAAQIAGALCIGVASAGADLAWSLWTTRAAPPERAADYASVHVFLTGVRGVVGPAIGFALAAGHGPTTVAWIAVAMIVGATLIMPRRTPREAAR
jgi:MFS family permease